MNDIHKIMLNELPLFNSEGITCHSIPVYSGSFFKMNGYFTFQNLPTIPRLVFGARNPKEVNKYQLHSEMVPVCGAVHTNGVVGP